MFEQSDRIRSNKFQAPAPSLRFLHTSFLHPSRFCYFHLTLASLFLTPTSVRHDDLMLFSSSSLLFISNLRFFSSAISLQFPPFSPVLLFTLLPLLSFPLSSFLCSARPSSSAHVDMSTVTFEADPLDLDAEEPPEFQGDPRSPKAMSGSVTSPQANIHRLPFFKKVT